MARRGQSVNCSRGNQRVLYEHELRQWKERSILIETLSVIKLTACMEHWMVIETRNEKLPIVCSFVPCQNRDRHSKPAPVTGSLCQIVNRSTVI